MAAGTSRGAGCKSFPRVATGTSKQIPRLGRFRLLLPKRRAGSFACRPRPSQGTMPVVWSARRQQRTNDFKRSVSNLDHSRGSCQALVAENFHRSLARGPERPKKIRGFLPRGQNFAAPKKRLRAGRVVSSIVVWRCRRGERISAGPRGRGRHGRLVFSFQCSVFSPLAPPRLGVSARALFPLAWFSEVSQNSSQASPARPSEPQVPSLRPSWRNFRHGLSCKRRGRRESNPQPSDRQSAGGPDRLGSLRMRPWERRPGGHSRAKRCKRRQTAANVAAVSRPGLAPGTRRRPINPSRR